MAKKSAAKQVTVDEAVMDAGGKPASDFKATVEAAMGITAANEARAKASALFAAPTPEMGTEIERLEVSDLRPSPENPRETLGDLADLVTAIERHGVLSPLLVRQVGDVGEVYFEIISGHRRHAAAMKAGLTQVPCIVLDVTSEQALTLNVAEQVHREQLSPAEEGRACRRLQDLAGYDVAQVAAKLGRSTSWVRGRLALTAATPEVREALQKGTVPLTLATALAALPTVKMQVEGLELAKRQLKYGTVDDALEELRSSYCRPLKGASWKMTDDVLVPEAGACSACPKNTQNERAPGLFDNVKAAPTCTDLPCYESKVRAAWAKKTAKYAAQGAKVLPISEGTKLFNHYADPPRLHAGSKYVLAKDLAQEDGSKRSWAQLVERIKDEKLRPVLHIAQDGSGGIHELYLADKVLAAVAEVLELKWAKKAVEREASGGAAAEAKDEWETARREREVTARVTAEVVRTVAERIAVKGLTLPQARAMATALTSDEDVTEYLTARGSPDTSARGVKKLRETAVVDELLALVFFHTHFETYDGLDPALVELAKAEGLDVKAMAKAHAAVLETEKAGKP